MTVLRLFFELAIDLQNARAQWETARSRCEDVQVHAHVSNRGEILEFLRSWVPEYGLSWEQCDIHGLMRFLGDLIWPNAFIKSGDSQAILAEGWEMECVESAMPNTLYQKKTQGFQRGHLGFEMYMCIYIYIHK